MMQDSAKKSLNQSSKIDQSKTSKLKKTASSSDLQTSKSEYLCCHDNLGVRNEQLNDLDLLFHLLGERQPRGLKRQASSVVASEAKKDKKTSTHEMDKTEFAR